MECIIVERYTFGVRNDTLVTPSKRITYFYSMTTWPLHVLNQLITVLSFTQSKIQAIWHKVVIGGYRASVHENVFQEIMKDTREYRVHARGQHLMPG